MATIWLDGTWCDRETAKISVYDHGLLYGDGVFEGIRAYNGKIFRLPEHIQRLYDSAQAIGLTIGMPQSEFCAITEETLKRSGLADAYIRPIVTRGVGDLGLDPRKCPKPSIIIIVDGIKLWGPEVYAKGLRVVTAGTPVPHHEALSPRVKSLNYLPHIMAKLEAVNAHADDALMLDPLGHVAEASGANLFLIKNGVVKTPPAHAGILKGVTRDFVIELVKEAGYGFEETILNRYDVYTADEAFFTGTAAEIVAIREVDGRQIGTELPGPITRDLTARFKARVTA